MHAKLKQLRPIDDPIGRHDTVLGLSPSLGDDQLVISDCITNDALQTKVTCKIQRRRSLVVGPVTTKFIEFIHVATDMFGTQPQVFVPQPQISLPDSFR